MTLNRTPSISFGSGVGRRSRGQVSSVVFPSEVGSSVLLVTQSAVIPPSLIPGETAPSLTSAAVLQVSITSGTPSVSTNRSSGTIYMVCVADGDAPSVAQIKAGQDSTGSAALTAQSQTVTVGGTQTFSTITGLTTGTPYDFWFVHTNGAGDSTAVKADFTPAYTLTASFSTFSSVADGGKYVWTNPNNAATSNNVRANCGEGSVWGGAGGSTETTDLLRSGSVSSWAGGGSPAGNILQVRVVVEGYFNSANNAETLSQIGVYKDSTATRLTMSPALAVAGTADIIHDVVFTGGSLTADDLTSANFYCDAKFSGTTTGSSSSGTNVGAFVDQIYVIVLCDDISAPPFTQNNVTLFWSFP